MPNLHADGTYKLVWHECPLLIIGISDIDRHFHPVAVAFSTRETTEAYFFCFNAIKREVERVYGAIIENTVQNLISDGAGAIKTAFDTAFPGKTKITCYAHVLRSVKNKTAFVTQDNKDLALSDLNVLYQCPTEKMFEVCMKHVIKRWEIDEPNFVHNLQYWLRDVNKNWYLGAAQRVPKTNNCLEAFNGRIKRDFTFNERTTIAVFKVKLFQMLRVLGGEYRDHVKQVGVEVRFEDALWLKGLEWARTKKQTIIEEGEDGCTIYFIRSGDINEISQADINNFKNPRQRSLDTLLPQIHSTYLVKIGQNFPLSTCTCLSFLKEYKCKHIIGLGLRLKKIQIPERIQRIEKSRRPGRPQSARPALEQQNED